MILHVALYNIQFDAYVQLGGSSSYLLVSLVLTNCCCMVKVHGTYIFLLHEYKDLFIDMDVRNNRSELAIANRHQER